MALAPRSREQRRRDTERRLGGDVDVWVATASTDGLPCLVPPSFDWDGQTLLLATPADSPTGRNLAAGGGVRLGLGPTRDVTLVGGDVEVLDVDAVHGRKGPGPGVRRTSSPGRDLMRDGRWLA